MKHILIVLLLISSISYGQKSLSTPYEKKMDSIAIANFNHVLIHNANSNARLIGYNPNRFIKLTISTGYNQKMRIAQMNEDGTSDGFDYVNLMMYDIRMKIRVNKRLGIVNRFLMTGMVSSKYVYTTGLLIKF